MAFDGGPGPGRKKRDSEAINARLDKAILIRVDQLIERVQCYSKKTVTRQEVIRQAVKKYLDMMNV